MRGTSPGKLLKSTKRKYTGVLLLVITGECFLGITCPCNAVGSGLWYVGMTSWHNCVHSDIPFHRPNHIGTQADTKAPPTLPDRAVSSTGTMGAVWGGGRTTVHCSSLQVSHNWMPLKPGHKDIRLNPHDTKILATGTNNSSHVKQQSRCNHHVDHTAWLRVEIHGFLISGFIYEQLHSLWTRWLKTNSWYHSLWLHAKQSWFLRC